MSKVVNESNTKDRFAEFVEGGATGVAGFWGLPFNLVFSTFLYFRAVQTIAMYYGFDVKNDISELIIAREVFTKALSPSHHDVNNEINGIISKVMVMTQASVIKQTASKTWADMAAKGGVPLRLAQMRALTNKVARQAVKDAGANSLERSVFKEVFEPIGRQLTKKNIQISVPVVSAGLGALIDSAQMHQVLEYADIFYQKRFILEKEDRVRSLMQPPSEIIDVTFVE